MCLFHKNEKKNSALQFRTKYIYFYLKKIKHPAVNEMDLFEDLPEPAQLTAGNQVARPAPSLFDDLPPANTSASTPAPSLFDELPPARDSAVPAPELSSRDGGKTEKRKAHGEDGAKDQELVEKKVCKGAPRLKGFVAARKGEREDMQDAHVLLNDFSAEVSPLPASVSRLSYFAVFDGHGGARASRFAAQNLHLNLARKFPKGDVSNMEKMVKKSLLDSFKQTDDDFLKHASSQKPAWKDGSTATCVLVVDDVLFIANLGDSRAVLCRASGEDSKKMSTLALSKEHNPTQYEERIRIQRAGGTVRDGRVLGVLEVSRSLGDGQYKRCGVISTPHLRRCQLTPNDRFLLLACDGLFKVFSPEEAVSFVVPILEEETLEQKEGKTLQDARFETACSRLANEAVRRGCADNVTVLLVNIEH
ncbi:integrin-linked kinase-associated serine/threonine phosphatase 2C isoform X2 [Polyodon spathula]|uniref:integrin-linked kinase-associated serine/threonine phosphatase 2C isoform X2 n=1 Tax=Polyodon spathula TaxID=7913 RepID=UPI001B7F77C0|nr:integrin-linked kinase-associated serine/threonine phosphatase 2C isoform X2 [Polyodon spathula]